MAFSKLCSTEVQTFGTQSIVIPTSEFQNVAKMVVKMLRY